MTYNIDNREETTVIMMNFIVNGRETGNKYPECLGEFVTLAEAKSYAENQCADIVGKDANDDVLYLSECSWAEVIDIDTGNVVATYGDK